MNHLKWMGHANTMLEIQTSLYCDESSYDITISSKGRGIRAHKFILSSASDLFRDILADVPTDQIDATIIIPDVNEHILKSVLNFIYVGEVTLSSNSLSDFLETTNLLGIKSAISFECNVGKSKQIVDLQNTGFVEPEEDSIIDKDDEEEQNNSEQTAVREFEYMEVYQEPEKISYTIEHIENQCGGSNSDEFILTENGGTYTLTQQAKLGDSTGGTAVKSDEISTEGEVLTISTEHNFESMIKPEKIRKPFKNEVNMPPSEIELKPDIKFNQLMVSKSEALDGAVDAVVKCGMSLQKAASKFSISKTVLWRRVKKHPQYMKFGRDNPLIDAACDRLRAGDSLKSISVSLEIPMSTLHRHKVRLAQEGRLPEYISFKKRGAISREELKAKLKQAVDACLNGMSQNHAANVYDVPKSTLWRHLQKQTNPRKDSIKQEVKVEQSFDSVQTNS